MKYFFNDQKNRDRLLIILESWVGTPYRHKSGVKGLGVDCAYFLSRVGEELGLVSQGALLPEYSRDFHNHVRDEIYAEFLRKHPLLVEVGITKPMDGDIILYKFGKIASHSAVYFGGYTYQARFRVGVVKFHWNQDKRRRRFGFRIKYKDINSKRSLDIR